MAIGIVPTAPNAGGGSEVGPGAEVELTVEVPTGRVAINGGVRRLSGLGTLTSDTVPTVLESRPAISSDGTTWDLTKWYVRVRNNASSGYLVVEPYAVHRAV